MITNNNQDPQNQPVYKPAAEPAAVAAPAAAPAPAFEQQTHQTSYTPAVAAAPTPAPAPSTAQPMPPYMAYPYPIPALKKEKRVYTVAEKVLLFAALAIAILFDRVILAYPTTVPAPMHYAAFSLCFLAIFYMFFRDKLRYDVISWFLTGSIVALCVWSFFFWDILSSRSSGSRNIGLINYPVIAAVMMGLIIYMTGDFKLKETGRIAIAWLCGFFVKPFSGISVFFGTLGASLFGEGKTNTKKAALGIAISLALLPVLLPLLSSADRVFGYHLMQILSSFNIASLIWHTIVIAVAFMLVYSFLWNVGFGTKKANTNESNVYGTNASETDAKEQKKIFAGIDTLTSSIVLSSVILLYTVFCIVQFTYLFAGAGLPGGISYSEYAREGFAQTVVICAINLLVFGVFLHFRKQSIVTTGLLLGLLALTGIMLFSGFIRLGLYIDYYGMTWLRLLSAWFIIYMAAVIIMCAIRLRLEKLPLIAISTLVLIGWYIVLGYINPDGFIAWYNQLLNYGTVISVY